MREWKVFTDAYATCSGCSCNRERQDLRLKIRVYAMGKMNVKAMDALLNLVKALGVDEENTLMTESTVSHYIDVPAEGIHTRLEIAKITTPSK